MEVKKVFNKVVTELNKMKCPEHNKPADVVITGTSDKPNIGLKNVCCESFKEELIKTAKEKLQIYFAGEIQKNVKQIFK